MKSQTQRGLLLAFIGSIALCGLVGIYCLLQGRFGTLEARIMGTTLVAGLASILAMASAIPWERRRWHPIGPLGILAVVVALILVMIAIWVEPSYKWEIFWKTMGVACVAGCGLPIAGTLSLARLRREYKWVRRVTIIVIILLATLVTYMIVAEKDDDKWGRAMGILAILVVCGCIAVPILHRVSAIRICEGTRTTELSLSLTCPRCGKTQKLPAGRSRCAECGLRFLIEIEEEQCRSCGYPLYRLTSSVCPECGTPFGSNDTA